MSTEKLMKRLKQEPTETKGEIDIMIRLQALNAKYNAETERLADLNKACTDSIDKIARLDEKRNALIVALMDQKNEFSNGAMSPKSLPDVDNRLASVKFEELSEKSFREEFLPITNLPIKSIQKENVGMRMNLRK